MGRKNRRVDEYIPIDVTPPERERSARRPGDPIPIPPRLSREERDRRTRERQDAQRQARIVRGMDWSVCIIPGCGRDLITWGRWVPPTRRDPDLEIPICYEHAALVWNQLARFHAERNEFADAIVTVNEAIAARQDRVEQAAKVALMANTTDGTMYFIRLGGLIKVGWTRSLRSRLKSYGASAELLLTYPASRDDETNLHRQLRPALAKGREWYEDGQIIAHFLTEALEKHGPPEQPENLWTQPKRIVAGKRVNRSA